MISFGRWKVYVQTLIEPPRRGDAEIRNMFHRSKDHPSVALRCHSSLLLFSLRLCVSAVILWSVATAQTLAPGGPGKDAQWPTAGKQAVGTSANPESKIWFTLANGVLTEVLYQDVSVANVQILQFVVVNPKTKKVETEWDDANHEIQSRAMSRSEKILGLPSETSVANVKLSEIYRNISMPNSLVFRQINRSKSGKWTISKTYLTDPKSNTVVFSVQFQSLDPADELYVYFDPSTANSGIKDSAWTDGRALLSADGNVVSALSCGRCKMSDMTNGFLGVNDGLTQLRSGGKIAHAHSRAENGNVVQVAKITPITIGRNKNRTHMVFALGFGTTPEEASKNSTGSLTKGFEKIYQEYQADWLEYLKKLPKVDPKYQAQFNMAAMVIKAQEDKTVSGANIASLTVPWGGGGNANEGGSGYRMIWSRDLYHVFTAYMAIGDKAAAGRALDFLFKVQQKADGSFPQNSDLTGKQGWGSLQMDEVGYPLIMAWQLERFDKETYEKHVKRVADFIVKTGPSSPQERWEERPGYSPSTIAAEIAGLVCAADIAKRNGDEASAIIYLAAADDWARNIERWTATTKGKYGDGNYYLRITANGNPDAGEKVELNNNAGTFYEHEIVDAGFLELVRLGIKPADDPLIVKSLKVIDQLLKVETPSGPGFYRYNNDGYGEMDDGRKWNWDGKYTGKGRPWPLLSGERGQYELALANSRFQVPNSKSSASDKKSGIWNSELSKAKSRLDHMLAFANEAYMLPEQVWDKKEVPANYDRTFVPELKFGKGTGSATPLAWSMGQFIRLATNLKAGRNLDTPQVVYARYKNGIPGQVGNFGASDEDVIVPLKPGATMKAERSAKAGSKIAYSIGGKTSMVTSDANGKAQLEFTMPAEPTLGTLGIQTPDGSTAFERITVRPAPAEQKFSPELIEKIKFATASPLVDGGNAVFFYRGKADVVQVVGDMTGWNPGRRFMQKIGDDLFATQIPFAATGRAEYKLIVNGKWELDPLNPKKMDNGVGGENNILEMPSYKATPWTQFPINGRTNGSSSIVSPGKIEEFAIETKDFGTRKIRVYYPGNYRGQDTARAYPVLYFQDGSQYISRTAAAKVQEHLVEAGKVKPFIMVFIDPKDRMKEYWANDQWADFVANELVPEIDKRYTTVKSRDGRALIGASLGGITSLHIGMRHPDKFSRLGGQSSSFWVDNERVVNEIEKLDAAKHKFKFYLDDGTLEGVDDTRRVNVLLRGKGFDVTYVEGETGHNWTAWRDRLADAFIALMN